MNSKPCAAAGVLGEEFCRELLAKIAEQRGDGHYGNTIDTFSALRFFAHEWVCSLKSGSVVFVHNS
jgi:hypothetical protein